MTRQPWKSDHASPPSVNHGQIVAATVVKWLQVMWSLLSQCFFGISTQYAFKFIVFLHQFARLTPQLQIKANLQVYIRKG